jgi:hypothetical protein
LSIGGNSGGFGLGHFSETELLNGFEYALLIDSLALSMPVDIDTSMTIEVRLVADVGNLEDGGPEAPNSSETLKVAYNLDSKEALVDLMSNGGQDVELIIRDLWGREILKIEKIELIANTKKTLAIETSKFKPGTLYVVLVKTKKGERLADKFIKPY